MDVLYFLVLPFLAKIICLDTTVLGIDTISVVKIRYNGNFSNIIATMDIVTSMMLMHCLIGIHSNNYRK